MGAITLGMDAPAHWKTSIAMMFPKTHSVTKISQFRQVVLDAILLKLYMGTITAVVRPYFEMQRWLAIQCAGRSGMQTCDLILITRLLIERALLWKGPPLIIIKTDISKAFDSLYHSAISTLR